MLLNRILHADHGLRAAVLVNDFGAVNIDSQLIVGVEGETVSLSNGCICCTIRGDLLKAVLELLRRAEPPEYILVETSGVSDLLEVALTFRAIQCVQIDSILTVMDAEQILSIDRRYAVLAMNQVGMADIVIVNKVDLVDAEQLTAVRAYIRSIIPNARVIEATEADVPLELLLNVGAFDLQRLSVRVPQDVHIHAEDEMHHEHDDEHEHEHTHTDHTLVFNTWSWQSPQPLSCRALKRAIAALPDTIYRAKGIFFLADDPDHQAVLQVVGRRATLTMERVWGNDAPHSQLVVIGAAGEIDAEDLNRRLEACLAINAPKSELEPLTTRVLEWLRGRLPTVS